MHLQIVEELQGGLGNVGWPMRMETGWEPIREWNVDDHSGLGMPLPNIGSMDGTQAAPKAQQRKRPCRSRPLSLILTVVR
jgi:hypothetical protein